MIKEGCKMHGKNLSIKTNERRKRLKHQRWAKLRSKQLSTLAINPSFHTVKQDQFDCKWLVKANLFQTKKETKAKTTPTSDAPAGTAKRRMSDSEGASKLSKQRAKKKFKTPEIVDTEDQTIADIGNQAQLQQRDQRCSQTPNK